MKKTYTCSSTGTYYLKSRDDGAKNVYISSGDSVSLTTSEYEDYSERFTENDTWKRPLDEVEVTTTGGTQSFTKTIEGAASSTQKYVSVAFTTDASTMPAGAIVYVDALDSSGTVLDTQTRKLGSLASRTAARYFSSSYLNGVTSYKVRGTVPQASGSNYTITIEIFEIDPTAVSYVSITNNGLSSGTLALGLQLKDSGNNDISNTKGFVKCAVCSDSVGTLGANTLLNGITTGRDGEIIETSDDQYFYLMSELDGDIDLELDPTTTTATYTELTISTGVPSDNDTVTFGSEVYEFYNNNGSDYSGGNILVDTDGAGSVTDAAVALKTAFNTNTSYNVIVTNSSGVVEFTATKYFEEYNSLATTDTEAGSKLAWEDSTFGGATGNSVTGVDATEFYLIFETDDGKRFLSDQLPYRM